ncbi:MAG: response regulator [Myxococcales bacterium]|nr:response regulator [Myxococcota bacterium]MDW8281423.1 response regulator [Myxococcales bacterium]
MAKVLIVEDDPEGANAMRLYLQFRGHEVAVAGSGEEAMQFLESLQDGSGYDIIITDLQLPGIRGDELARRLLARCAISPKLIALSGEPSQQEAAPFHLRLRKPCKPRALVDAIDTLLGQ